jgi:hypothetical protein
MPIVYLSPQGDSPSNPPEASSASYQNTVGVGGAGD